MIKKGAIEAAIIAHQQWKVKLYEVINTGETSLNVNSVRKDNICLFGQWINNLTPEELDCGHYKKVKDYHTQFHIVAADILELAISGKRNEALDRLQDGFEYDDISIRMTRALNAWKEKLKL